MNEEVRYDPNKYVDVIFPGYNIPIVFLWFFIFLCYLSFIFPTNIFDVFFYLLISIFSWIGLIKKSIRKDINLAGQFFIVSTLAFSQKFFVDQTVTHHSVAFFSCIFLLALSFFRGHTSLPLGPALIYVALSLNVETISLDLLVWLPLIITISFFVYIKMKAFHLMPPIVSLLAVAIYVDNISSIPFTYETPYKFIILALILALIALVYINRNINSKHKNLLSSNPTILLIEDITIYLLGWSLLALFSDYLPENNKFILSLYFIIFSIVAFKNNNYVHGVSAITVAIIGCIPVINDYNDIRAITKTSELSILIGAFLILSIVSIVAASKTRSRLPRHLAKILLVTAMAIILMGLKKFYIENLEINTYGDVLSVFVLTMSTLSLGLFTGHSDIHLPNEAFWKGIIAYRYLVELRRMLHKFANQIYRVPIIGLLVSFILYLIITIRNSFGPNKSLTLSHITQILLLLLFIPIITELAQLTFKIKQVNLIDYGLSIKLYTIFILSLFLYTIGSTFKQAYMRLFALVLCIPYSLYYSIIPILFLNKEIIITLLSIILSVYIISYTWRTPSINRIFFKENVSTKSLHRKKNLVFFTRKPSTYIILIIVFSYFCYFIINTTKYRKTVTVAYIEEKFNDLIQNVIIEKQENNHKQEDKTENNTKYENDNPPEHSTFELKKNTDMPGNDYQKPSNNNGLKSITFQQCQDKCISLKDCVAFTYNSNAKWCFLKNKIGATKPHKGAITGFKD